MTGTYTIQLSDGETTLPVIYPLETDGPDSHQITAIQSVSLTGGAGTNYFSIAGDLTAVFIGGFTFSVYGSNGGLNDETFTVVSTGATLVSGYTHIPVTETISSGTTPYGNILYSVLSSSTPRSIKSVSLTGGAGTNYFTVNGDLTYRFTSGFPFSVQLSGSADGNYTVNGSSSLTVLSAATQGYQTVHFSTAQVLTNPTGLANNATIYTAIVYFTNSSGLLSYVNLNITGSTAQTISTLLVQIGNALGSNATAALVGGDIQITSAISGATSRINIIDNTLFMSLTSFSSIYNPVNGTDANQYTTIPVTQTIAGSSLPLGQIVYSILPTTSLALPGKGNLNYGQHIVTDFIRLLENFAGPAAPTPPIRGQFWFDTNTNTVKVFDGLIWSDDLGDYVLKSGDSMSGILSMGSQGYQIVNVDGIVSNSSATGLSHGYDVVSFTAPHLVSDSTGLVSLTTYTASITVDGGAAINLSISGSSALDFASLLSLINSALGITASAIIDGNGNIRITSASYGTSSSVVITDTGTDPLFAALTNFSAIDASVAGTAGTTLFTASITVDGGVPVSISVASSATQTYEELIAEINTALGTSAVATIIDGNIKVISSSSGSSSTILIADVGPNNLFASLTTYVAIDAAIAGADNKITNLATPTNGTDAANKSYVDSAIAAAIPPYEYFSATAGQTVFNLSFSYTPGSYKLMIFVNGVKQVYPQNGNYTETNSTTVTFTTGLNLNDQVEFYILA